MKEYFVSFSDGNCDDFEARNDFSAYNKACKLAKKLESYKCFGTYVTYLAETFEENEEDRVVYKA